LFNDWLGGNDLFNDRLCGTDLLNDWRWRNHNLDFFFRTGWSNLARWSSRSQGSWCLCTCNNFNAK
jgi:hypothetical protein